MSQNLTKTGFRSKELDTTGHLKPEEIPVVFGSLLEKLLNSQARGETGIFNPLADFVAITGMKPELSEDFQRNIQELIEDKLRWTMHAQENQEAGIYEPHWGVIEFCSWGIIATHLGIEYSLEPKFFDDQMQVVKFMKEWELASGFFESLRSNF